MYYWMLPEKKKKKKKKKKKNLSYNFINFKFIVNSSIELLP